MRRFLATGLVILLGATLARSEPLSRKTDIDFFRDVPSRNLKGLATRSDGRLVSGPAYLEIAGPAPADLLWSIESTPDPARFLAGTGPDGRILEITFNATNASYTSRELVRLDDPQVFTVRRLRDGGILAGTSPRGGLHLVREDKVVARVVLPVDSIFDLLVLDENTVLAATGNPGRIYRIDIRKFGGVGLITDKITDAKILADRGITVFGEIRDRNVRRLAAFKDGRIVAGSSPKGNIYTFPADGGPAVILQENREAEVTDLLPQPNGDLYATIIFSGTSGESRMTPGGNRTPAGERKEREPAETTLPPVQVEKFSGRSSLVWFPANGFAETLSSRANAAFYRIARHGDLIVVAAGDTGELLGFDLQSRFALTFPGSGSAQLNGLIPIVGAPGKFLVLRNNAPGLGLLDFTATGVREAETRRIDLNTPSTLGALRFSRLRNVAPEALTLEVRLNNGTDEAEGWGPWTALTLSPDGGWRAANLRGRSAKLRIRLAAPADANAGPAELDRASLYALPQNRRPQLQEFRVLSPNYAIIPAVEPPPSPVVTVGQLLQPNPRDEDKRKSSMSGSQIVPQPGAQVVFWNVNDPDGDAFTCTFSYRRDGDTQWTDVVTDTDDSFAQFDSGHLPDGIYFTRLVAREIAPRPVSDRLTHTFETDDLVVDHTAPELVQATARRVGDSVLVSVQGRDALSLLEKADVLFSNGVQHSIEQPADGVRDGRDETFTVDVPTAHVSNATSVEVTLYDSAGNSVAKRLTW